jgi:hypothetical protein
VTLEHLLAHLAQRCLHRRDLGEDIDAVTVFFDHPHHALDLPSDPLQARDRPLGGGRLGVVAHRHLEGGT